MSFDSPRHRHRFNASFKFVQTFRVEVLEVRSALTVELSSAQLTGVLETLTELLELVKYDCQKHVFCKTALSLLQLFFY